MPTLEKYLKCHGRGELHLGILIETMRREGYELMVSMPRVVIKGQQQRRTIRRGYCQLRW